MKGILEMEMAADAPIMPSTSGGFSISDERIVIVIWISLCRPLGNSGLMDRSVNLEARIPSCPGRPSRRKKLPGILPTEYIRSS